MHYNDVMPKNKKTESILAAVDLGSNSFHLVVARLHHGHLTVLDHLRERVQLGAGLDARDRLSAAAQRRALACLARFRQRLKGLPATAVRAVGTQTLRRAHDAAAFLLKAQRALGFPIEIVAGREEARLIYLGVAHSIAADARRRLVIDIGGGSTELIIGERFTPLITESLDMGCVSFSRRFFPDGRVRRADWQAAELAAQLELEPVRESFRHIGWFAATGASGTVRAAAQIVLAQGWGDEGIGAHSLDKLRDALLRAGHVDRVRLERLNDERRSVLAGGLAILHALFKTFDLERLEVAEGALREGVLYDLLGRIEHRDMRALTIDALSSRYQIDIAQAQRVARTAEKLLDACAKRWHLNGSSGVQAPQVLQWAARLHEIGLAVAHTQYHKHGAYIVENADMPGFSRQEQNLVAALIRGHRRKFPTAALLQLPRAHAVATEHLCVLLRLAVLLHRSRSDTRLPRLQLQAAPRRLALRFPRAWLARHPLTHADLLQEAELLREVGFKLTLR